MTYAHKEATGIPFVPSMALGVLVTAPFVTVGLILAGQAPWNLFTKASAIPGILAGCLWNGGNVSSMQALSASVQSMMDLCAVRCRALTSVQQSLLCSPADVLHIGNTESQCWLGHCLPYHAG